MIVFAVLIMAASPNWEEEVVFPEHKAFKRTY